MNLSTGEILSPKITIELKDELSLEFSISSNNECSFCDKKNHELMYLYQTDQIYDEYFDSVRAFLRDNC